MVLVAPKGLARLLPLAHTTPTDSPFVTEMPGNKGFRPRIYFIQLGTPSPAGIALGAAAGLFAEPKYWICHASASPSLLLSPVKSAMDALRTPTAKATLWTPRLPSSVTNCQL